jgi:hypothetical protein
MSSKKNQKPIEIDAHFKYRCTNCNIDHWISLNQAKTKNYKIVCDCGKVFIPKRISKVRVKYFEEPDSSRSQQKTNVAITIQSDILEKCIGVLIGYGFTKQEADNLVKQSYIKNQTNDCGQIIKHILESIGANNNEQHSSIVI